MLLTYQMDIGSDVYSLSVENEDLLIGMKHYFNAMIRAINDTKNIYETMEMVKKNKVKMEQKQDIVLEEIVKVEGVLVSDFQELSGKLDLLEKKLS